MRGRPNIKVNPAEELLLQQLYFIRGFPIDQYAQRPDERRALCAEWRSLTGRTDADDEIFRFMRTRRKNHRWITFDGNYNPLKCPSVPDLEPEVWLALDKAYTEIGVGRDNYGSDGTLRQRLSARIAELTGKAFSGEFLYACLMARQKASMLPVLPSGSKPQQGIGFGDIDMVA